MAVFFADTFPGSGSLDGKAPDTAYGSLNWDVTSGDVNESSGYAEVPLVMGTEYDSGWYSYGSPSSSYGNPDSIEATFVWRTHSNVNTATAGHYGFRLKFYVDDVADLYVKISAAYNSDWTLRFGSDVLGTETTADVDAAISASTDYTGTIKYNATNGLAELTFLGETMSFTVESGGDSNGFRALEIEQGSGDKLASISIDEYTTPSSGAVIFPALQGQGYGGATGAVAFSALTGSGRGGATGAGILPMLHAGGALIFSDRFDGPSGTLLTAHRPNTNFGAYTAWDTGTGTLDGGGSAIGSAVYGTFSGPTPSNPTSWTARFMMKTPSDVSTATAKTALLLQFTMRNTGGSYRALALRTIGSGNSWRIDVGDNTGDDFTENVSISASTEYEGSFSVNNTTHSWTIDFMGVRETGLLSALNPAWETDIKFITLTQGSGASMLYLDVESGAWMPDSLGNNGVNGTLPALQGKGYGGGYMSRSLPALSGRGTGGPRDNAVRGTLPSIVGRGYGGATARATLPALRGAGVGTVVNLGQGAVTLPALQGAGHGTVGGVGHGAGSLPALQGKGYGGGWLAATFAPFTGQGRGSGGSVGRLNGLLPALRGAGSGTAHNVGHGAGIFPALVAGPYGRVHGVLPALVGSGSGGPTTVVTFEAYAINLQPSTDAGVYPVTRYTSMPFSGIVRFRGSYYGWGPGGLYLLGGDTDAGQSIAWSLHTAATNFGSRQLKVVRETFLHGRISPTATARVSVGEAADVSYAAVIHRGSKAQAHRIKYGRGLKADYWSFGLADVTGSAMEIDSMQHEPEALSRKV